MSELTCFKAYDVRGRIPGELNVDIAYRIGRAYAEVVQPKEVVVGYDIRLSSKEMCDSLTQGLRDSGVNVHNIGQCGTEEIYFATFYATVNGDSGEQKLDGGIVVTASHNPKDFNGMKFVREGSKPISGDTGLLDIKASAEKNQFTDAANIGSLKNLDVKQDYIDHLLGYVDVAKLKPLKIVVNAGNGGAGDVIDRIEASLPFEFIKVHHNADGNFPHGVPNPLLIENRQSTIEAMKVSGADLGLAWDGDFDRCFFFDENANFVEGYYLVGLLAEAFLNKNSGEKVVHDPRLTWNTIDIVEKAGGTAVQSKTGHAFIKERMRAEDAVYGGEMSAHHYFRDFAYCDSGMIPWLLVTALISQRGLSLSQLVQQRTEAYPCSGEINSRIDDPAAILKKVEAHYQATALSTDFVDGLSMVFDQWRFNLRMSNTEPVVRLNVESRADITLMQSKRDELLVLMGV